MNSVSPSMLSPVIMFLLPSPDHHNYHQPPVSYIQGAPGPNASLGEGMQLIGGGGGLRRMLAMRNLGLGMGGLGLQGVTGLPIITLGSNGVTSLGMIGGAINNLAAMTRTLSNDLSRNQRQALQVQIANLVTAMRMSQMGLTGPLPTIGLGIRLNNE